MVARKRIWVGWVWPLRSRAWVWHCASGKGQLLHLHQKLLARQLQSLWGIKIIFQCSDLVSLCLLSCCQDITKMSAFLYIWKTRLSIAHFFWGGARMCCRDLMRLRRKCPLHGLPPQALASCRIQNSCFSFCHRSLIEKSILISSTTVESGPACSQWNFQACPLAIT